MLEGFKKFLMRGNVLDLAIAVVIGTAFATVVKTVVDNLVSPLIAAIGGSNVNGLAVQLNDKNDKTIIDFGAMINALVVFFLTAVVVYFVLVVPMKKLQDRRAAKLGTAEAEPEPLTMDQEILIEIRDALRARQ
ncbi:large conductance mechanosensitive channel protein MscL [Streptomyces sp. SID13031]|uniref:large conductance mechanosensitive channel protein MscL n=1 Tax=Streptomyces sp. SID13031 TaxID=2706046 RepID=UPI0013C5E874|nr:large conductance mechanosensitive channel protein MscL [Streptomyces sp. SID13031]NEA37291.1 large conductance mechanosensitive channel protein MscL [Streptomyces sp. SID13031]